MVSDPQYATRAKRSDQVGIATILPASTGRTFPYSIFAMRNGVTEVSGSRNL
jgi:hypothetical protein